MSACSSILATQALILAGGLGTRLGERTNDCPKPILSVGGKAFLEYLVWNLARHGIRRLILSVGYLAEKTQDHFGDGSAFGVEISYCVESSPLGTGGAVKLAEAQLDEHFFVLNGDTLFDINYLDLLRCVPLGFDSVFLALRQVADAGRYGRVVTEGQTVSSFAEKAGAGEAWINGGIYLMDRRVLDRLPEGISSLESDLFPGLAAEGALLAKQCNGFFIDIGTPLTFNEGQTSLPAWQQRPIAFLDRDGVLNRDHGYVHKQEDFDWVPGAAAAVRLLNEKGFLVVVVTNQAGIGRGYYTEADFLQIMRWVQAELMKKGGHFDDVLFCPYHAEHGIGRYKKDSFDRKPNPGMLFQAFAKWPAHKESSFLIGDTDRDRQAAENAGVRFFKFSVDQDHNLFDFVSRCLLTLS